MEKAVYYNMTLGEIIATCMSNKVRVIGELFSKCGCFRNEYNPEQLIFNEIRIFSNISGYGDIVFERRYASSKAESDYFSFPIDIFFDNEKLEEYIRMSNG